jgi:hypothetical protein
MNKYKLFRNSVSECVAPLDYWRLQGARMDILEEIELIGDNDRFRTYREFHNCYEAVNVRENYEEEWGEHAKDRHGNKYLIYFHFTQTKYNEVGWYALPWDEAHVYCVKNIPFSTGDSK